MIAFPFSPNGMPARDRSKLLPLQRSCDALSGQVQPVRTRLLVVQDGRALPDTVKAEGQPPATTNGIETDPRRTDDSVRDSNGHRTDPVVDDVMVGQRADTVGTSATPHQKPEDLVFITQKRRFRGTDDFRIVGRQEQILLAKKPALAKPFVWSVANRFQRARRLLSFLGFRPRTGTEETSKRERDRERALPVSTTASHIEMPLGGMRTPEQ